MTSQTVQQLIQVFRRFGDNHAAGMPLHRAYREAVRAVASIYSVKYQTIGDGCRRRLGLDDVSELYELLAAWMRGDPSGLVRQLKENADTTTHAEIDQFFSGKKGAAAEIKKTARKASLREESEPFTFRIAPSDARMLKALAELEGVSAPELTAQIVSSAVRDRMTTVARGIIKSADGDASK
jgi:hypothetical protein